jgi:hypothetical protein
MRSKITKRPDRFTNEDCNWQKWMSQIDLTMMTVAAEAYR